MSKARELAELGAVYDSGALSNRNFIINGNMEVAQRGTSQTAAGYGTLDRFQLSLSGASATMTQESFTIGQTDVVGSDKYLKLAVSTGNNNSGVYHKIEAKNAFPVIGQKVTLSYYAKGTSPSAGLEVAIGWYDGSSSSPLASTAVTLTSSWVKYTHTFDVPSISGLTLTNAAAYLEVHWIQSNSDTGTGAYEVNLAQTQLELGTEATPFEHRSFGDELARCQRYYSREETAAGGAYKRYGAGSWNSATAFECLIPLSTPMRSTPALETTGTASNYAIYSANAVDALTLISITNDSDAGTYNRSVALVMTTAGGGVAGEGGALLANNDTDNFLALDAEL